MCSLVASYLMSHSLECCLEPREVNGSRAWWRVGSARDRASFDVWSGELHLLLHQHGKVSCHGLREVAICSQWPYAGSESVEVGKTRLAGPCWQGTLPNTTDGTPPQCQWDSESYTFMLTVVTKLRKFLALGQTACG